MTTSLQRCHDTTPLPLDGVVRVVRAVEAEAEQILAEGGLVYVRGPRKSGKTSLARRLEDRFDRELASGDRRRVVRLELANVAHQSSIEGFAAVLGKWQRDALGKLSGSANLTPEQAARLRQVLEASGFWAAVAEFTRLADTPVVVFVDEVEEVLGEQRALGESWLVSLRQVHQDAEGRLAVCVLGQLPANLLVRSAERTPFNTARELVLPDFELPEVRAMVHASVDTRFQDMDLGPLIARAVYNETGGQPNLTQALLGTIQKAVGARPDAVADYPDLVRDFLDSEECRPTTSNTYMAIDSAFLEPGVWPVEDALEAYALMLENGASSAPGAQPTVTYDPWNDGHCMLEAIGLAKPQVRADTGERLLVIRNRIAQRIFDRDWVNRRRLGLPADGGRSDRPTPSATLAAMERIARETVCASEWARKHRARVVDGSGREAVEGTLFEFELVRESPAERLTLQMFKGVGQLGRRLWTHQVRTLRQVVDRAVALPSIYRGSVLEDLGVAYVITQRPGISLTDVGVYDFIRANPGWALDQFESLAEGLDRLAEEGIVHGTIWPGSIRLDPPDDAGVPAQLKFANFEFSIMLRSVVGAGGDPAQIVGERRKALRRAFLQQPKQSRPYAPPEYLDGLFAEDGMPVSAAVTSGVFSLGLVVATWFLGPLDAAGFAAVLRDEAEGATYSPVAHAAYVAEVERGMLEAEVKQRLPAALGRLLREMIALQPRRRPTPSEVVEALRGNAAALRSWTSGERKPLLVCYSYRQSAERLAAEGLISSAINTEDNRRDVEEFFQRELRDATLFYAPLGIGPYVDTPEPAQFAAQWVLKGASWLFYSQRFERRGRGLGASMQADHILRIAYPWPLQKVWRGLPTDLVRLSDYGAVFVAEQQGSPEMDRANDHMYQSWNAILARAAGRAPPPSFEIAKTAFAWLVEAQREALELQRFPIRAVGDIDDRTQAYELDEAAYRRWTAQTAMRSQVYQSSSILNPGDFFEQVMQEAWGQADRQVRLRARVGGQTRGSRWATAELVDVSAAGVRIRGVSLPKTAQIELRSNALGRFPLEQQSVAIDELSASPTLFDQLLQPHVVVDEEAVGDKRVDEAVEHLAGRAGEVVRKIVSSAPLTALQGPPGTGKTTVTAAVIHALLLRDKTERILVTSQSHAAVDNIALRIGELEIVERDRTVCVRVAADEQFETGDRIDERLRRWRPEAIAQRLAEDIRRRCAQRLSTALGEGERAAYEQLARAAAVGQLELADRVREGANLVFSTTAGSRRVARDGYLPRGRFDLAVVDEASKAWPTEIIQPMLIADRQLLVGDHRQLPAFGSTTIDRLLNQCIASNREEFRVFANHRSAIEAWLRLFASFFSEKGAAKFVTASEQQRLPGWRDRQDVAEQLDLQFRMRSDIAEVVSRAFYEGKLQSDPRVDTRPRPPWLQQFAEEIGASRGVLWVDMRPDRGFPSVSPVQHPDQAKAAALLLSRAAELGGPLSLEDAVILSPYRQQNDALRRALAMQGRGDLVDNVHTVDSFQGREAELVVLSLVRGPGRDRGAGSATDRYGFMVQPERVNVMFSRARGLLVVLADFDFYAEAAEVEKSKHPHPTFDLTFWEKVCRTVSERGRLIDYSELPGSLRIR